MQVNYLELNAGFFCLQWVRGGGPIGDAAVDNDGEGEKCSGDVGDTPGGFMGFEEKNPSELLGVLVTAALWNGAQKR